MLISPHQVPDSVPTGVTQMMTRPALPAGVVVYLLDVKQQLVPDDVASQILNQAEKDRAGRFKRTELQRQYTQCHAVLRLVLAYHTHQSAPSIELQTGKQGKPSLTGTAAKTGIHFNLSHSGSLAAIAISNEAVVGVDIEKVRPNRDLERIAAHFFAPSECRNIQALPRDKQTNAFFTCWCRKESFIKAMGLGLSMPLDKFSVSVLPDEPAVLESIDYKGEDITNWRMFTLVTPPDYFGAVTLAMPH